MADLTEPGWIDTCVFLSATCQRIAGGTRACTEGFLSGLRPHIRLGRYDTCQDKKKVVGFSIRTPEGMTRGVVKGENKNKKEGG